MPSMETRGMRRWLSSLGKCSFDHGGGNALLGQVAASRNAGCGHLLRRAICVSALAGGADTRLGDAIVAAAARGRHRLLPGSGAGLLDRLDDGRSRAVCADLAVPVDGGVRRRDRLERRGERELVGREGLLRGALAVRHGLGSRRRRRARAGAAEPRNGAGQLGPKHRSKWAGRWTARRTGPVG